MNAMFLTVTLCCSCVLGAAALTSYRQPESSPAPTSAASQPTGELATVNVKLTGTAATAVQRAADAHKYVFLFFYQADDGQTQTARKAFEEAMWQLDTKADMAEVNRTDAAEQEFVKRFGLDRAPMPLILSMAPNGAITRTFVGSVNEAKLRSAFVSSGMTKCLKGVQDRKLVFACVQGPTTQHNAEAMQGVRDFAADNQNAGLCEIITIDPADDAEAGFLSQLNVDPKTAEAVTVFLAPPGTIVSAYTGATQKEVLFAAAKNAAASCDPKSGCCPTSKPATPPPQPSSDQNKKSDTKL